MLGFNKFSFALPETSVLPSREFSERAEDTSLLQKGERTPFVLIFGNHSDTRFLFRTLLELWSFEIKEVETVEESIFIADIKCPDLILMDVALPFSESLAMMTRMQESNKLKNVPFILLSGLAQKSFRDDALAFGAADYLVKPINYDLLENSLKSHLVDSNIITNREVTDG